MVVLRKTSKSSTDSGSGSGAGALGAVGGVETAAAAGGDETDWLRAGTSLGRSAGVAISSRRDVAASRLFATSQRTRSRELYTMRSYRLISVVRLCMLFWAAILAAMDDELCAARHDTARTGESGQVDSKALGFDMESCRAVLGLGDESSRCRRRCVAVEAGPMLRQEARGILPLGGLPGTGRRTLTSRQQLSIDGDGMDGGHTVAQDAM